MNCNSYKKNASIFFECQQILRHLFPKDVSVQGFQKIVGVYHIMHFNTHHSRQIVSIRIHSNIYQFNTYRFNTYPFNTYPFNTYPFNTYRFNRYPFNTYPFNAYPLIT